MVDIFDRLSKSLGGPIGQYMTSSHGYFTFPKLEGELSPRMFFNGRSMLNWSLNNYLALANHPQVREADSRAAAKYGMSHPMGSRMMSGDSLLHEELEGRLAQFIDKPAALLLNFGYQGIFSIIDTLLSHRDVVVYDSESHASIIDGLRMHRGRRFVYRHNDITSLRMQLEMARELSDKQGGGILVITEGVFGMRGDLGRLDEIVALKSAYGFRLLIDDAHGFGTMGERGRGTASHFGVTHDIDLIFSTFAKSMASIGGFVAGERWIIELLRYNMRSQLYAKSLPSVVVAGVLKRLEIIESDTTLLDRLWVVTRHLQEGLRSNGFNIGNTQSPVTPIYLRGGVNEATNLVVDLRERYSLFCSIVVYPVIPRGEIILRVIPTAAHTLEDVEQTIEAFSAVRCRLESGDYASLPMPNMSQMCYQ